MFEFTIVWMENGKEHAKVTGAASSRATALNDIAELVLLYQHADYINVTFRAPKEATNV